MSRLALLWALARDRCLLSLKRFSFINCLNMWRFFSPWEGVLILGQLHFQPFRKVFLRQALFCWLRWPWSQTLALQGNDLVILYIPLPSTILELSAHTTSEFKNYPFESCSWLSIAVRGKGFACERGVCLQTRTGRTVYCVHCRGNRTGSQILESPLWKRT